MADVASPPKAELPKKPRLGATEAGSPKIIKKKAEEVPEPVSKHLDDTESHDNVTNNGEDEDEQTETAEDRTNEAEEEEGSEAIAAGSIDHDGNVVDKAGNIIGKASENLPEGSIVDQEGDVLDDEGNVIGRADLEDTTKGVKDAAETVDKPKEPGSEKLHVADPAEVDKPELDKPELNGPFGVQDGGEITNASGVPIGKLLEGDPQDLVATSIKEIDKEGNLRVASGSTIGKADLNPELLEEADAASAGIPSKLDDKVEGAAGIEVGEEGLKELEPKPQAEVPEAELPDLSILEGKKLNKLGKAVDENGTPYGQLVEGDPKKLFGKKVDAEGKIWSDTGKILGRVELLPDDEREPPKQAPFEDFPDSIVDKSGNVMYEGQIVGKLIDGDAKKLAGKKVDADGDVLDKHGNVLGKAERYEEEEVVPEEPEAPEVADLSSLEGKKVNKAGNVVDDNGKLFGRVVDGELSRLVGKTVDAEGKIWSSGKVIGTAELIPVDERDEIVGGPFEDFPDAIVDKSGKVLYEGQVIGRLIEGDAKKLAGKKVDKDGEVVDKVGNVLGKAERWEEEEEAAPEPIDNSLLAGKRVNKVGNVVDAHGSIFGRLVEGDPKKLAGRMCDKNGNVLSEGGDIIGKAELVPESEREGLKEGPFADFDNPTVAKEGKVVDARGLVIGRLIEGDAKKLFGKMVDADGDVLDRNGNTLGKAERWEEEEEVKQKHPAAGRKVNKEGNVVDENGDVIAKLTEGSLLKCAGKTIDDDGDVVDGKGTSIGHVSLLEDIPEPEQQPEEPEETEEEIENRKQLEQDKKLASMMGACIDQSLDKIKPILKLITDAIDTAERQPKEELDEQKLVDTVKPLLEEGGQILQEANGAIRALDPDGRIQTNAKHKTAAREATPEEYRLADSLKELTGSVATTIEQAKKKIAGMPHAKKELNPLWGLLAEPLGQIIAAVGLLLSGVLGLVGRLLSGLGLGGLLDNLLGGLGIKGILEGLGLGMITKSLTGKK